MSRPRTKRDTKKQIVDRFLHEAALMKTSPEDIATMRQMLERVTLEELITKYLPEWESSLYKQRPVPIREWVNDHMGLKGQIYPMLLDDMEEMFEDNYSEIILSGCIDHNALIMEADGGLPTLGERIGTERDVLTIMDAKGMSTSPTVNTRDSGVKKVRQITLRNGYELKLTPDHRVRVYRDGYQWVPAEDIVEGDYVLTPRKVTTTPSVKTTLDEAKFLAYWITNGSLKKNHTSARYASANLATVKELAEVLDRLGYDSSIYPLKGTTAWEVYVKRVKSSGFLDKLLTSDVVHTAHSAKVPDAITRASNKVVATYLNRVWAAEGTCYSGSNGKSPPRFVLAMASERFVKQVQLLLLRFGIQSRVRLNTHYDKRRGTTTYTYELAVTGIRDLQLFLGSIGPVLGKEDRCEEIADYCAEREANTNVDLLPLTLGELNKMITESDIIRPAGDPWWGISTRPSQRVSRAVQTKFIEDYPGHPIAEWLASEFPEDVAYTPVTSNVELDEPIPTGDIGALNGNRFIANGIDTHNSIGFGKSFLVALILTRIVYELSCYKNPQHALGLADGSPIVIPNVALKLATAQEVVFRYMQNFIRGSEYFREEFPPDKDLTKSMQFPHSITVQPVATTNASVIGLNVYSACFPGEQEFLLSDGTLGRMVDYVDKTVTVPTLDKHGKVHDVTTRVVKTGVKPLVKITLSNGDTIESTADQKFQDENGNWLRAEDAQGRRIRFNQVQDMWRIPRLPNPALEGNAQPNVERVQGEVSEQSPYRETVYGVRGRKERGYGHRPDCLCSMWSNDDRYDGYSHAGSWNDLTGVPCEVPGCAVEGTTGAEGSIREGTGARLEAKPRPGVQGIAQARSSEDTGYGVRNASLHIHEQGRREPDSTLEDGDMRGRVAGLRGRDVGVRSYDLPGNGCEREGSRLSARLLHPPIEQVHRSEVKVHRGYEQGRVERPEDVHGKSYVRGVQRDTKGYGTTPLARLDGVEEAYRGHDNLRRSLEDWTLVECIAVEPIPDSVQDVYDLEDTGSTHIFFAKTDSGFVQGKNCLDEVNFFERIVNSKRGDGVNEVFDQAENMYRMLHNRITSRFLHPDGTYPGKLLMVSSARYPDDFTTRKYEEAKAAGKKVFYRRYSQWEPKYGKSGYPGKTFQVSIGNSAVRPRVIRDASHDAYEPNLDDVAQLKSEGIKIIDVPEEHRTAFEIDVDAAVRDIAGYPTLSRHPFFRDMEPWHRSFKRAEERGLRHPWTKLLHVTLDDGSTWIRDYLDETKRLYPHFVHIDLALTQDAAGVSVVRLDGVEEIEHLTMVTDPTTGEVTESPTMEYAPNLTAVLLQQIMPVKGREIPISKVRRIVLDLVNWGFNIKKVTFDAYQSADSIQQFRQLNIDAGQVSMDRSTEPSTTLKELLEQDRLDVYNHPVLKDEAAAVELDLAKGKIDHPPGGCLTGDTLVMTNKGLVPIETLAEAGSNHTFWAHGVTTDGDILVAEAYNAHMTGRNQHVVKVMLSNGKHIRATPDHRFMLADGSYLPAAELTAGQALMAPGDVVTVTDVFPDGKADVYDITVPATSNFLTGAGVAVHNSKDVLDSLTGAVYSAVTYVTLNGGQVIKGEFVEDDRDSPVLLSFDYGDENSFLEDYKWLYD